MVRDSHLAEDVTQGVFVALAQNARQLTDRPVLSGWLHRTAQNLAANAVRTDVRRRAREQEAAAMNELLSSKTDATWEQIAPHLDAALGELSEADRDALMLRYFERKSAHEMAQTLGVSDEAAQKRVSRAVERLREFFAKRGVAIGVSGLVVVISANAVQAAPVGLAVTVSVAAALAETTIATTASATATKAIAMTTLQKSLIAATLVAAVGVGIYESRQASVASARAEALQQQQTSLTGQLARERDEAARQLAALRDERERLNRDTGELLKLRGEVTRLKADSQALAQLKASNTNDQTLSEAVVWKNRVNQLKQYLEQSPAANIPELQFVTEEDWLDAARQKLNTETDYRRALSALRNSAQNKVVSMFQKAVTAYKDAGRGQFPTDFDQLQPYFDPPVDPAVLDRWQVTSGKTVPSIGAGDIIITQKAPVDDVFDRRLVFGSDGGQGATDFLPPEHWAAMKPVYEAYRAAHNGQWHKDFSELQPYATTPEQQAALQKMLLLNSGRK